MKSLASSLSTVVNREISSNYALRFARAIEPGRVFSTVDGKSYRVVGKQASATDISLRLASKDKSFRVSVRDLAELAPASPSMRRLASLVHHIIAFDKTIDQYVKQAITASGLPIDPTMKWDKFLYGMYAPALRRVTKDEDLIDDAIRQIVIDELFEKRILSPDAPGYHFIEGHDALKGKPLERQVSAFLTMVFSKRVPQAVDWVRIQLGVGSKGQLGRQTTYSLLNTHEQGEEDGGEALLSSTSGPSFENKDIAELEDTQEVHAFLHAFMDYAAEYERESTVRGLRAITEAAMKGMDRSEIKKYVLGLGIRGRDAELTDETYKLLITKWAKLIQKFATDPNEGWDNQPVARAIAYAAKRIADGLGPRKTKTPVAASLKTSDHENPNLIQQETMKPTMKVPPLPPAGSPPPPTTVSVQPPPAPALPISGPAPQTPSPSMDKGFQKPEEEEPETTMPQQQTASSKSSTDARIAALRNDKLPAPKKAAEKCLICGKWITREGYKPGVCFGCSTDNDWKEKREGEMRVGKLTRFARLRHIAENEPEEMADALGQLKEIVNTMADSLDTLTEVLDLVPVEVAKDASVRQKVAARNKYATRFRRIAEDNPEEFAEMLNNFYSQLEDVVDKTEILAENTDVELDIPITGDTEHADDDTSTVDETWSSTDEPIEEASESVETPDEEESEEFKFARRKRIAAIRARIAARKKQ